MHTKDSLIADIKKTGINPRGTLLIHSSMKAVGETEGGGETVIDAFIEYMKDGLLLFPTHSWSEKSNPGGVFDVRNEKSCVGILSNLFMKRKGVSRSLHPTHSISALGKDAEAFIAGEELCDTPCPCNGCWGKLYDLGASILFLGCSLKTNTFIHGVEEWAGIPNRLADKPKVFKVIKADGGEFFRTLRGHFCDKGDVSRNYDKLLPAFLKLGIAVKCKIGDAECFLCDAKGMADLTLGLLEIDSDLLINDTPLPDQINGLF